MSITRNAGATRANSTAETPPWSRAREAGLTDTDGLRLCDGLGQVEELHVRGCAPRTRRGEGVDHHRREVVGAVAVAIRRRASTRARYGDVGAVARGRRYPC